MLSHKINSSSVKYSTSLKHTQFIIEGLTRHCIIKSSGLHTTNDRRKNPYGAKANYLITINKNNSSGADQDTVYCVKTTRTPPKYSSSCMRPTEVYTNFIASLVAFPTLKAHRSRSTDLCYILKILKLEMVLRLINNHLKHQSQP